MRLYQSDEWELGHCRLPGPLNDRGTQLAKKSGLPSSLMTMVTHINEAEWLGAATIAGSTRHNRSSLGIPPNAGQLPYQHLHFTTDYERCKISEHL
jgi:hypothetical protein